MKKFTHGAAAMFVAAAFFVPMFTLADTPSISIQALTPGATVVANSRLAFGIVALGFAPQTYQLSDSFNGTSVTTSDINAGGNFFWVPIASDAGTHTLTITALDGQGLSASATQVITVLPPPSVVIQSLSPGQVVLPGSTLSFSVTAPGFTNPTFIVGDQFSGSSVTDSDITTAGNFSWVPDISQDGNHTISIYASDSLGHNASASQAIQVGAGPSLLAQVTSASASVSPGQPVTIVVSGVNFVPTNFSVTDSFLNSTVIGGYMTSQGTFTWTPQTSDIGSHTLTFMGIIGNYGLSATTSKTITVLGPNGYQPPLPPVSTTTVATSTQPTTPAPAPTTTSTPTPGFVFSVYLYPGLQSTDVAHLQTILTGLGYFSGNATGYYGALTTAAVQKYQAALGLNQLGVVGPATRAALNALESTTPSSTTTASPSDVSVPSSTSGAYAFNNFMGFGEDTTDGNDVLELQNRLLTLGFFSGTPSGYFGSATEAAVKAFQTSQGITATGFVGSQTRAALNK